MRYVCLRDSGEDLLLRRLRWCLDLSPEQELQLYHHYGLDVGSPPPLPDRDFGKLAGQEEHT
ncbi:hypothetical protein SUDANB32_05411 [Streptomyces sp. enrichment culture]